MAAFVADAVIKRSVLELQVGSPVCDFDRVLNDVDYVEDIDKRRTTMRRDYGIVEPGFTRDPDCMWKCFSLNLSVHRLRWGVVIPPAIPIGGSRPQSVLSLDELEFELASHGQAITESGTQFRDFRRYVSNSGAAVTVTAEAFDDQMVAGSIWSVEL
ncbi:hypothetical protein [Nocardia sp. SSK8]|uniref:hypothetical protein n=1 Tax=Nocardia sp. SSK8 TaxID=3120154 RepID=UPI003008E417